MTNGADFGVYLRVDPEIRNSTFVIRHLKCGSSSVGRAIAFQAIGREFEPRLPLFWVQGTKYKVRLHSSYFALRSFKSRCSSVVEHFLGKEEVDSSILFNGSGRDRARLVSTMCS
jgi:hypothetical protein